MANAATAENQVIPGPGPERIIARFRSHGRVLFLPSLVLIAACGAVGYFSGNLPETWMTIPLYAAGALVALVAFVLPLVAWLTRRYTITTRRLIVRKGFWVRQRQDLLHSRGYDTTVRKTWLQSLFGSGDVRISGATAQPVVLKDVPQAVLVQHVLQDEVELNRLALSTYLHEPITPDHTTALGSR